MLDRILPMPNQWRNLISYLCQQGHKLLIDQYQINGHDLMSYDINRTLAHIISMPNQWAAILSAIDVNKDTSY